MSNIDDQFEYILNREFETTLDQFARTFGLDRYEQPQPPRYRLLDGEGRPIKCRYCEADNLWYDAGGVWHCNHWGTEFLDLMPLQPVDGVVEMSEVAGWVEV